MSSNGLNEYLLLLIGLVIALLGFQTSIKRNPRRTITRIITKSKYKDYLPYILAQSKLETGNFTSRLALEEKNLFGMGVPSKRKSLRIGEYLAPNGERFSVYKNWSDSVNDYLLYLKEFNVPTNLNTCRQYITYLKNNGYATDPAYIDKVVKICNE